MSRFPLAPSDIVVIFGYLGLVLYVGFYFRKRMRGAGDYWGGGHQGHWRPAGNG